MNDAETIIMSCFSAEEQDEDRQTMAEEEKGRMSAKKSPRENPPESAGVQEPRIRRINMI